MEVLSISQERSAIQWKQLWSLAALYGSVVIGWIAYENYQPKLLETFNFTAFAFPLNVTQAIILAITPLIAGRLGDRYRQTKGHRIPIIMTGISFAAMVFMAVAFTLLSNPGEILKWILPLLIVCWLIAMSIFTSPALSTVELFTPVDKLPRAMAMLTIVANLIYAVEPVIVDIIDYVGAPLTFVAGGLVVFASGFALQKNSLSLFNLSDDKEKATMLGGSAVARSGYVYIFFLGLALGVPTSIMFKVFPDVFDAKLTYLMSISSGKMMVVYLLVFVAIMSLPASNLVSKIGTRNSFWIGFGVIMTSIALIFMLDPGYAVLFFTIVFGMMFSLLSVSSLPLALENSALHEKVFCVGIFFSGVAIPEGLIESIKAF